MFVAEPLQPGHLATGVGHQRSAAGRTQRHWRTPFGHRRTQYVPRGVFGGVKTCENDTLLVKSHTCNMYNCITIEHGDIYITVVDLPIEHSDCP